MLVHAHRFVSPRSSKGFLEHTFGLNSRNRFQQRSVLRTNSGWMTLDGAALMNLTPEDGFTLFVPRRPKIVQGVVNHVTEMLLGERALKVRNDVWTFRGKRVPVIGEPIVIGCLGLMAVRAEIAAIGVELS
jgi:hypothetical protein